MQSNNAKKQRSSKPAKQAKAENRSVRQVMRLRFPHQAQQEVSWAGDVKRTDQILQSLKIISHATSLGGVESLIERRTRYEAEREAGIPMTLCRFSVGIENVEDLWSDLESAISVVLG